MLAGTLKGDTTASTIRASTTINLLSVVERALVLPPSLSAMIVTGENQGDSWESWSPTAKEGMGDGNNLA